MNAVERIARALCAANNNGAEELDATGKDNDEEGYQEEWRFYEDDAKCAVEEMTKPTRGMIKAGCAVSLVPWAECEAIYIAMMQEAKTCEHYPFDHSSGLSNKP